jgi:transposase-like protein
MAKARRKRTQYSAEQKKTILAAALKDKLTALQVKRKFGVTPVTYYSWRKKSGLVARRGSIRPGRPAGIAIGSGIEGQVRAAVQAKVRALLPAIVRNEVSSYLDSLFRASGRRVRL